VAPRTIEIRDFGIPSDFARILTTALFASLSAGTAVTKTLTGSPGSTRLRDDFGVTLILSSASRRLLTVDFQHSVGRRFRVKSRQVLLKQGAETR